MNRVAKTLRITDSGDIEVVDFFDEEIRAAKEAAWDEGHNHCFHVEDPNNKERNPYREESK